ncbi:MAG TPA: alpha-L-arabinofuranosidase C-terminal domain-containing protein [Steroidobacteraceae bacterium]|jgi:alpha-N-arabinofuranosidase|nr:alpha-L-arabinofuranosidase C-terminal domain-containing protein [Steroidobacteraceae bacterium]
MLKTLLLVFAAAMMGMVRAVADPVLPTVVIPLRIDASHPGPKIDRNIFGQFAEHLGSGIYGGIWVGKDSSIPNVRGIRTDVVTALRALHVPNVRWPGGCFGDEYHWRDGIGPVAGRKTTVNSNWGGALEPNSFGTDEFMDFLDQIGSEAYISVNVGSGTPAEAAAWMAYMTADPATSAGRERAQNGHPAPYRVKFLGIGNESWGCGGAMTPDYYVSQLKLYARYVRNFNPAQVGEQAMRRVAVGADGGKTEYVEAVMKAWRDKVWSWDIEGLSLHSYTSAGWPPAHPSVGFGVDEYATLLKDTLAMDPLIAKHSAIMDQYDPHQVLPLAVDEWGVWLAPLPGSNPGFLVQQNSLRDAILAALNFNIFARHADRVRMANIAQMVNVLQSMIMTDQGRMVLTPTYHVFRMYTPFQDSTLLPVAVDGGTFTRGTISLPHIDAVAARDVRGNIWLAAVNLDPERSVRIRVSFGDTPVKSAHGEVLTGAQADAINTFDAPHTVQPTPIDGVAAHGALVVQLPAKSVSVMQLR